VTPSIALSFYAHTGTSGGLADDLLRGWVAAHWDTVKASGEYFVTPFSATPEYQLYGVLIPVYVEGEFAGILAATLDFAPVLDSYIVPLRSGRYGAAWIQDANSLVIYDHESEEIGRYVTDLARDYPDLAEINRRLMTESEGQGEYHYTIERGGRVARKLVAWSTAHIGNQRLTVVLAAPDSEISANLANSREQTLILGVLLGVTLVTSGGLFYAARQRTLKKEVAARTQELEQLTGELEQRVTRRTDQLEQERAQLRTILEAMDDGLIYRQAEQIIYLNSAFVRLLGYTHDELRSRSHEVFEEVTSPSDPSMRTSWREDFADALAHNNMLRHEARLKRKDGSQFDANVYIAQVHDRNNQPIGTVEIIRDISHEKSLQAQRDRFITNAAHELRRPLTNLKTRVYLLGRQPDKLHEHLEIIQRAADDMAELVQDLVDMAQLAGNAPDLNRRDIVLQHVLNSALDIQQEHAYRLRVQLSSSVPERPVHTHADYQRLTQTMNNLIAHAIQSTAPDGSVQVRLYTQSDRAIVEIDDDGPTIEQAHLVFVFEPFFLASEGSIQRTGMGLALARQIIEQHGGQISARSETGRNRFTIHLPLMADSG
jgi:PAS domain S-box-containing protein